MADESNNPNPQNPPEESTPQNPPEGKTYTQEQLNSMMAAEKRTARSALLKELGIELKDDKDYKSAVDNLKKTLDAGKTQAQLDAEARKAAEDALGEASAKAAALEMKVLALSAGAVPTAVDDIIALISTRVSQGETTEKAIEELKTKYPSFFSSEGSGSKGTGSPTNPPSKKAPGTEGLGQRLAKTNKTTVKSTYFKN